MWYTIGMRKIEPFGEEILRRDASEQWIDGVFEVHDSPYARYDDDDESRPYVFDISRPQGRFRFSCRVFGADAKNRCRRLSEGDLVYLRGQIYERVYLRSDGTETSYIWISPVLIKHIGSVDGTAQDDDDDDVFGSLDSPAPAPVRSVAQESVRPNDFFDEDIVFAELEPYDDDEVDDEADDEVDDDDDETDDENLVVDFGDSEETDSQDETETEETDSFVLRIETTDSESTDVSRRKGRRKAETVSVVEDPFA